MKPAPGEAFAIWITGLPASGKSTLSQELALRLEARDVHPAVLESDELRKVFAPELSYSEPDRERFYGQLAYIAALLVKHGVPVIVDATANRRSYREQARRQIPRFFEVYVDTPLAECMARDPKGIYRRGGEGSSENVPGLQAAYEPPENPDWVVHGEPPSQAADEILQRLQLAGDLL